MVLAVAVDVAGTGPTVVRGDGLGSPSRAVHAPASRATHSSTAAQHGLRSVIQRAYVRGVALILSRQSAERAPIRPRARLWRDRIRDQERPQFPRGPDIRPA
ncbi:hypothetical protein GCM10022236_28250 [Microlunatus ginsengisoli]|uniref:Uncharacterized protein n=1 Tax=Microlunatus ginsengisoli TaxID=363863 RepID=A0ABP7A3M0_9ACTN